MPNYTPLLVGIINESYLRNFITIPCRLMRTMVGSRASLRSFDFTLIKTAKVEDESGLAEDMAFASSMSVSN